MMHIGRMQEVFPLLFSKVLFFFSIAVVLATFEQTETLKYDQLRKQQSLYHIDFIAFS